MEINRLKEILKYTDTFLTNKIEEIREKNDSKIKELKKENQNLKTINESMSVKVNEQQIEDQNKTCPCNKCNFTFESKPDFEYHLQGIQHNIATGEKSEIDDSDEEDDDDNIREKCYLCQKIFTDFNNLDDHQSNYKFGVKKVLFVITMNLNARSMIIVMIKI